MSGPPSYAPTATSSFTIPTTNYHEEITRSSLIHSTADKDVLNSFAEIYSIVTVLEMIEKAFIKDYITNKEKQTSTSLRLINQYQIILKGFKEDATKIHTCQKFLADLAEGFENFLSCFSQTFKLNCPLAVKRLTLGIPVTIELMGDEGSSGFNSTRESNTATPLGNQGTGASTSQNARLIAESTSSFITCMDALKLSYNTKDQLHPLLSELVINLNELSEENSKFDFQGKSKLVNWLIKLNNLQDELSTADTEQFLDDLNVAYKNFYMTLE